MYTGSIPVLASILPKFTGMHLKQIVFMCLHLLMEN